MKPKDSIPRYVLTGLSGVVMSHAVVTDAAQLLYLPGSEIQNARYIIADNGERVPLLEATAYTSGSPTMSIAEAVEFYLRNRS